MFAGQGVFRRLVIRLRERGGPPPSYNVTRTAFAVVSAADELALVLILMAIYALLVRDRFLEVRILVAFLAGKPLMLPVERELRLAVVKRAPRDLHTLPARGVVARLAARRKRAMMRILMAPAAR
jgi:hypothetical protein